LAHFNGLSVQRNIMTFRPAAEVGMPLADVDTPCLLLELDAFERNLTRLMDSLRGTGIKLRPHAKSHKCPEIALRQIAQGAVGVCCQKVSEAEALVAGGIGDVLMANEVVGAPKLRRLVELAKRAGVKACADDAGNVAVEQLTEPIKVEGLEPKAQIRGFTPAAPTGPPVPSSRRNYRSPTVH
jgi:D-serine deaminase-like pyridoxal phosphate-dependent protein